MSHMKAELAWFPNNRPAREALATSAMLNQDWPSARDHYEHLASGPGATPTDRVGWAQALFNLKEFDAAVQVLAPVLKSRPPASALLLHANLLAKQGHKAEGQKVFEAAQALKAAEVEAAKGALVKP